MNIVAIIKLLLSLASSIAQYAHDKRLMDAGANEAILKGISDANDAITRANSARNNASQLPVSEDKNNRDNKN